MENAYKRSLLSGQEVPSNEAFNRIGISYQEAFAHDEGLLKTVTKFIGHLRPDALLLDCGCGTGKPVAEMIARSGRRVHGIDMSSTMIDICREQVPEGTFELANLLGYHPSELYDGVVLMFSLFELSREELTLASRQWIEWLHPGGLILIGVFGAEDCETTSTMYDADRKFATRVPNRFMNHEVFSNLFIKSGWNELLETAGFTIIHSETDWFSPPAESMSNDEPHYYVIGRKSRL